MIYCCNLYCVTMTMQEVFISGALNRVNSPPSMVSGCLLAVPDQADCGGLVIGLRNKMKEFEQLVSGQAINNAILTTRTCTK